MSVRYAALFLVSFALPGCANTIAESRGLHPGSAEPGHITEVRDDAAGSSAPVMITPEVLHGFSFLYQHINQTEFVLCLEGARKRGRVYVTGFRLAVMTKSTIGSASYEPCTNANYIGTAHNHPPVQPAALLCATSLPDRSSFLHDQRALVDIILCGQSRYLWVLKDGRYDVGDSTKPVQQLLAKSAR